MELSERIIAYIEKHHPLALTTLEGVVVSKGFTLEELYAALTKVHKDKRVLQSTRGNEVYYTIAPVITKQPSSHLTFVRNNYPPMTPDNDGSSIEADFSYLFLTPEQLVEYKAAAKNMPTFMYNKTHGRQK